MRDCCTYTPPAEGESGRWALCPAHAEAREVLYASEQFRTLLKAAANGHLDAQRFGDPRRATVVLDAAMAAVGAGIDLHVLFTDPALARRFLDALDLL